MTDEALYAAGDFAALVKLYRPSLVIYAAQRTGQGERLADDALGRLSELPPDRLLRPWLYAMLDQLCLPHDTPEHRARLDAMFAE